MAELRTDGLCASFLGPIWRYPPDSEVGLAPDRLDGRGFERPNGAARRLRDENDLRWRGNLPAHAGLLLSKGLLHSPRDAGKPYAACVRRVELRVQGIYRLLLTV